MFSVCMVHSRGSIDVGSIELNHACVTVILPYSGDRSYAMYNSKCYVVRDHYTRIVLDAFTRHHVP